MPPSMRSDRVRFTDTASAWSMRRRSRIRTASVRAGGIRAPYQNSMLSGSTRNPLQRGGRGISRPSNSRFDLRRCCCFERVARFQRFRLLRCPGAELAARAGARRNRHRPRRRSTISTSPSIRTCTPLAHARPVEQQRRARIGLQFAALAAVEVGVEHETARIVRLQQHGARRRPAHRARPWPPSSRCGRVRRRPAPRRTTARRWPGLRRTGRIRSLRYCRAMSTGPHPMAATGADARLRRSASSPHASTTRWTHGARVLRHHRPAGHAASPRSPRRWRRSRHARGQRVAVLSIDDFYLDQDANAQRSARDVHPLLATRGPPGTHDVALALRDPRRAARRAARRSCRASTRSPTGACPWRSGRSSGPVRPGAAGRLVPRTPRRNARDELRDTDQCAGARRRSATAPGALVQRCAWRATIRRCGNASTALLFLQGPGFEVVPDWRWQQEQTLQAAHPDRQAMIARAGRALRAVLRARQPAGVAHAAGHRRPDRPAGCRTQSL